MLMGEDRDKRGEWYLFGDRKIVGRENKTGKGRKEGFWRIEDKAREGTLWNIRARRFRARMRERALPKLRYTCIHIHTHRGKESLRAREVLQGSPTDAEAAA